MSFRKSPAGFRAHASDLALVKEMGLKETGILTSVSDYHIFLKLNWDRKKAMEDYLGIVKAALDLGVFPGATSKTSPGRTSMAFASPSPSS